MELGLTVEDASRFSMLRLFRSVAFPDHREYKREASWEWDIVQEHAKKVDSNNPRAITIPDEVLTVRALSAGADTAGGFVVQTEVQSIVEIMVERTFALNNCIVLDNLTGSVSIPGQDDRAVATFVGEAGEVSEQSPSFRSVALKPKRLGFYIDTSRQLLVQANVDVEMFLRRDIGRAMAKAIDWGGLYGNPSDTDRTSPAANVNEPTGIIGTTNVNKVSWGSDVANLFEKICEAERLTSASNVPAANLKWLVSNGLRRKLKSTRRFGVADPNPNKAAAHVIGDWGAEALWQPYDGNGNGVVAPEGKVLDYPAHCSSQVANSEMFFGRWNDIVLAMFGGLEILEDVYTVGLKNQIRFVSNQRVDVGVRQPKAFVHVDDTAA